MPLVSLLLCSLLSSAHAAPARAPAAPTTYALDAGASRVSFELSASLNDLHGAASNLSGTLSLEGKDGVSGALQIPVAGLSTGLGPRDAKIQAGALAADRYPSIVFEVQSASNRALLAAGSGSGEVDLVGTLTVRGQSRPLTVRADATWKDGALVLAGAAPLRWADLGLPTADLGYTTLLSSVNVRFNVQLRPTS